MQNRALCIGFVTKVPQTPRADSRRPVHVHALAGRTDPERIVLQPDSDQQPVRLEFRAFVPAGQATKLRSIGPGVSVSSRHALVPACLSQAERCT